MKHLVVDQITTKNQLHTVFSALKAILKELVRDRAENLSRLLQDRICINQKPKNERS